MDTKNNLENDPQALDSQNNLNNSQSMDGVCEVLYSKQNYKIINKKTKHKCKIIKFSSEWNFNEILENLSKLEATHFPNLFILKIEMKSFGFRKPKSNPVHEQLKTLKHFVLKFMKDRPVVLNLTSEIERITKYYYKDDNIDELICINQDQVCENFYDFPTFFCCLMEGKIKAFDKIFFQKILSIKNSHLALKLLKLWIEENIKNPADLNIKLIFKCASKGSKKDFLVALDTPIDNQENIQILDTQCYLSELFELDDASHKKSEHTNKISNQQHESLPKSVLQCAVENSNTEVIEFLINKCTHLIQQLPFDNQILISNTAYQTKQFKVLADLLEHSDFPFPNKFKADSVPDARLRQIAFDRNKFYGGNFMAEDFIKISKFIDKYPNLKIARNPKNDSALYKALKSKRYQSFFRLKSIGFQATEYENYKDLINSDRGLRKAKEMASRITKENIMKSIQSDNKTVMLLRTRSFIHNKKTSKDVAKEYLKKIKSWYECIYKTEFGPKLLNAVVQCVELKIIYDFDNESVENVDLRNSSNALGATYPLSKTIFIGAKMTGENREQEIKGIIAHELCHYVMRLVYENNENPFYVGDEEVAKIFEGIIAEICKWKFDDSDEDEDVDEEDDECDGIIASVFKSYKEDCYSPELIVRPVHILAQFDDNKEKTAYLKEKYAILFNFFIQYVLPELVKFNLIERENVMKFNKNVEVVMEIESKNLKFVADKNFKNIFDSQNAVIISNVPKLLLINIHEYLKRGSGNLVNSRNVFINSAIPIDGTKFKDFEKLLKNDPNLKVFVEGLNNTLWELLSKIASNVYFIVSDKTQINEIFKSISNIEEISINYSWNDLAIESQKKLLQTKTNFQCCSEISLLDLISDQNHLEHDADFLAELSDIIDDQLLNLLVDNSKISINAKLFEELNNDQYFNCLFRPRHFYKHIKNEFNTLETKISQDELLADVKVEKYVLMSDIAGTGKSWALKNLTKNLSQLYSSNWISYIDLKQFTSILKPDKNVSEFINLMTEIIMKTHEKFEMEIFKKLYQNGKVVVLLDGFDEICPM